MILDNDTHIQDNVLPITPEILESHPDFKKHNIRTWTYITKTGTEIVFSLSYMYDFDKTVWYARVNIPMYRSLEIANFNRLIDACECAAELYGLYTKMESEYVIPSREEIVRILNKYHVEQCC